jgi:hypothetical protein
MLMLMMGEVLDWCNSIVVVMIIVGIIHRNTILNTTSRV